MGDDSPKCNQSTEAIKIKHATAPGLFNREVKPPVKAQCKTATQCARRGDYEAVSKGHPG